MEKICPLCGVKFTCNHDKIADCQCSKVKLTDTEIEHIKMTYDGCLCIDCLIKIKNNRKK